MKKTILSAMLILLGAAAYADEGMWLVGANDKALEQNMKKAGCKCSMKDIYDPTNPDALSGAVVSLDFGCTGSIVSPNGLLITNHHCAYADIAALSTNTNNYLNDGFWARSIKEEIPIAGKSAFILREMKNITQEVEQIRKSDPACSKAMGSRKLSYIVEKKYAEQYPGKEVQLYFMYGGAEYWLAVYDQYKDIRLVAAPPVCVGAYGAEVDNWEWPQHKGDFAFYRIYASADGKPAEYSVKNKPLYSPNHLSISTTALKKGSYTMVLGFPGSTNRYCSAAEVLALALSEYPLVATLQKERIEIMKRHMEADPVVRLKYADRYFMLTNVQEIRENEAICLQKARVAERLKNQREGRVSKALIDSLVTIYARVQRAEENIRCFQECFIRSGHMFKYASIVSTAKDDPRAKLQELVASIDIPLEKEIYCLNIREVADRIPSRMWGSELASWYIKYGPEKAGEAIWNASAISSDDPAGATKDDPMIKVMNSMKMVSFNNAKRVLEGEEGLVSLRRRYKVELYNYAKANGIPQYPDANSSLRLTYGNVKDLQPADAVIRKEFSTTEGIMEKYNPIDYNFTLKKELADLYRAKDWGKWAAPDGTMRVNFITTNDITGGNSGSPVLDARGKLVGLAFDGNKEGLACDVYYDARMNRCVCVDIRYVLWILDKYAHMDYLLEEIL